MGGGGGKGGGKSPLDIAANVGTGGLYGVGKGIEKGRPLDAINSIGPWGSVVQPTLGTGPAMAGNLVGVGAGLGGGGLGGGGFGNASSGAAMDLGPGPMVGVNEAGQPLYLVKGAGGVAEMTAGEAASAGILPFTMGGLGGGGLSGSSMGAAMGAGAGQTASQLIQGLTSSTPMPSGGTIPSPYPTGGALPGGPSPAQLSAVASEKHPGLAPWFGMRARGQQPAGGIAEPGNAEALGMMAQNPNLWMRG